ncbi:hypothetical protein QFZ41_002655 [Luteibacter sp. W1I16]|jgi:hypothetical protein
MASGRATGAPSYPPAGKEERRTRPFGGVLNAEGVVKSL